MNNSFSYFLVERQHKCEECDKRFTTRYKFKNHTCLPKIHECKECNEKFATIRSLTNHKRIHSGMHNIHTTDEWFY